MRIIDMDYKIPRNWMEIQSHLGKERWIQTAREEFEHHKHNSTWELLLPSSEINVIKGRWIFSIKRGSNGEIVRYKTR